MDSIEALQAMLKGAKIRVSYWEPTEYIELDKENNVVDSHGRTYIINNVDFKSKWEILSYEAGTILKHNNGNLYRLIISPDNTYSIVNTETYMVVREHIRKDMLGLLLGVEGYKVKQW
ncbi:hypothetical protein [Lactobacillus phage Semele]|uniref:Uncharacterized protein n=1 Tax=Lactobacillus phage Semele TaxID=2079433 RepID=A0A2K9VD58_9CAUD|nr:hypothetical protein HOS80_gp131 [Lactobacillus phage Semele]AUV60157.1 hypothetical protein [Lactobacillus phage Semele]